MSLLQWLNSHKMSEARAWEMKHAIGLGNMTIMIRPTLYICC